MLGEAVDGIVAHSGLRRGSPGAAGDGMGWTGATCSSGMQKSLWGGMGKQQSPVLCRILCAPAVGGAAPVGVAVTAVTAVTSWVSSGHEPSAEELWGKVCAELSSGGGGHPCSGLVPLRWLLEASELWG